MKRRLIIPIILLISIFSLPSCLFQEEDIFPKSAAERTDEAIVELHDLLKSAGGWQVTYYTDTTYFGAYNMIMRFDGKKVYIQGDNVFEPGVHSGYYTFNKSQGVILAFNTYNAVLGYLADPGENMTGVGLGGDNEFIWERKEPQSSDTIYFRAKKNGSKLKFIRYEGNWDEYFNKIEFIFQRFNSDDMNKYFKMIYFEDGTEVAFSGYDEIYRTLNPTYIVKGSEGDSVVSVQNGIEFTEAGISFYKPINYIDTEGRIKVFQHILYDGNRFVVTADDGVKGYLTAVNQPAFEFPGQLSDLLFKTRTYILTGLSKAYNELYSEMAKMVPNFRRVAFVPAATGGYYISVMVQKGDDLVNVYLAGFTINTMVDDRSDKFRFRTARDIQIGVSADPRLTAEDIEFYYKLLPDFEGPYSNFIKAIFPTGTIGGGGETYIASPDGLYRSFTFGSTENNKYFRITNM